MPTPVTIQPITIAPGPALLEMSDGRLKTPPPIIEPTTSAIKGASVSLDVSLAPLSLPTVTACVVMGSPIGSYSLYLVIVSPLMAGPESPFVALHQETMLFPVAHHDLVG